MIEKDSDIQSWFDDELSNSEETASSEDSVKEVVKKTRRAVGQKDTMELVFVKIWAAMAELIAPLFANAASKHARMSHATRLQTPKPDSISDYTEK